MKETRYLSSTGWLFLTLAELSELGIMLHLTLGKPEVL